MPEGTEGMTGADNTGAVSTESPTGSVEGQETANMEMAKTDHSESQSPGRTFTQAEVDSLLGKTRQEGRDRAIAGLLKEVGVKDAETLKNIVHEAEEKRRQQLSEVEKMTEEVARLKPFEELASSQEESLKKYQKAVDGYVKSLSETLEVPDHVKPLLETMDSLAKLAYLTEHGAAFSKSPTSTPPTTNAASKGSGTNGKDRANKVRQKYGIR